MVVVSKLSLFKYFDIQIIIRVRRLTLFLKLEDRIELKNNRLYNY